MLSIVVPAYNEESVIADTLKKCFDAASSIGDGAIEVIVVDDGSTDDTARAARKAGAQVIQHPHNVGYGAAIKTGIQHAKNGIIVISDGDGTYPVDRIPDLLLEYGKGFHMVVGARQGYAHHEGFGKGFFRMILKILVEFTAGRKIPDINSGLRIFNKAEILPYFPTLCDTFSFTTSLTLGYMMTGKFVKYLPIQYNKRVGKSKVRIFRDSLRTMQFIVEAILYYNPIKIFISFSFVLLIFAVMSVAGAVLCRLKSMYFVTLACMILAVLMFGIGLLSVQLKHILHHENPK